MGLYKSGLQLSPVRYSSASEFDIVFECKPQRFLISGDRAISPTEWSDVQTGSGELVTIESDGSLAVKALEVSLEPIQSGSGTPSPTNVRPISGRTEVVTHRTGKNLYEALTSGGRTNSGITWTYNADGSVTAVGTATGNSWSYGTAPSVILSSGTYTVSVTSPFSLVIQNVTDGGYFYNGDNSTATFTISKDTTVRIHARVKNGTTINQTTGIMLEVGSSASEWQPYNGQTYTTSLGRTVYGGTLDVVSGSLTDKMGKITADDFSNFVNGSSSGGLHWVEATVSVTANAEAISSMLEWKATGSAWGSSTECFATENGKIRVYTSETSLADFKTKYADLQVVYPLATPQTYQLTPQQIDLLLGTNHLWSDGEITVEYGVSPYYNPTPFDARPLLVVTGSGDLNINGKALSIYNGASGQVIYIDCETMEAWEVVNGVKTSRNDYIQNAGDSFPVLSAGNNSVVLGSGITSVQITPRWWRV